MHVIPSRRAVLAGLGGLALAQVAPLSAAAAAPASGRRIPFGFRPADPLVMVAEDGSVSGLEYEIILAAMAVPGHEIVPYFGPNARLTQALFRAAVDGIAPAVAMAGTQFTLSDSYLTYANVAISLTRSALTIDSVGDLAQYRISAFQRARQALGDDFSASAGKSIAYREEGEQYRQALALVHRRADVIVGDRRVLLHNLRRAMNDAGFWEELTIHPIFPANHYSAAFRDRQIATDFNRGLDVIRADGTYQAILDRYPSLY